MYNLINVLMNTMERSSCGEKNRVLEGEEILYEYGLEPDYVFDILT